MRENYPEDNMPIYDEYEEERRMSPRYPQRKPYRQPEGIYNMDRRQEHRNEEEHYTKDNLIGYHRGGGMRTNPSQDMVHSSPEHAFKKVLERQAVALKMHMDMANLFEFLGLKGFKMMHEYQLAEEGACYRNTEKHYLSHYNKLINVDDAEFLSIIPTNWYGYTRFDVTPAIRKRTVIELFDEWKDWEEETKELYSHLATALINNKHFVAGNYIGELAKETAEELKKLEKLYLELKTVEFDSVYVEGMQSRLYNTYKNKLKEVDRAY